MSYINFVEISEKCQCLNSSSMRDICHFRARLYHLVTKSRRVQLSGTASGRCAEGRGFYSSRKSAGFSPNSLCN